MPNPVLSNFTASLLLETGRFIFLLDVEIKISVKHRALQACGYHGHHHPFLPPLESSYFILVIYSEVILLFLTSVSEQIREFVSMWYREFHKGLKMMSWIFFFPILSTEVHKMNYQSSADLGEVLLEDNYNRRVGVQNGIFGSSLNTEW